MAMFHGKVGFLIPETNEETGISTPKAVEKPYYGKVKEHARRWTPSEHPNDDLTLSNVIEITANDYAFKHHSCIAYIVYMGNYWKVESIGVNAPNITLHIGGVWNGQTAASAGASSDCS